MPCLQLLFVLGMLLATSDGMLAATNVVGIMVKVNATGDSGGLPHFFQGTGFMHASDLLEERSRLNMLMARGGGYRLMRFHCTLDLIDISGETSTPEYNFSKVDQVFDSILAAHLTPLLLKHMFLCECIARVPTISIF